MPLQIAFWVLFVISLVYYFTDGRAATPRFPWGGAILVFVLLALLGWKTFGPAIT